MEEDRHGEMVKEMHGENSQGWGGVAMFGRPEVELKQRWKEGKERYKIRVRVNDGVRVRIR